MGGRRVDFVGESAEALGIEKGMFNTFRRGDKYAGAQPGDVIDFHVVRPRDDNRSSVGFGLVTAVRHATLGELFDEEHHLNNHLALAVKRDGVEMTSEESAAGLTVVLKSMYGDEIDMDTEFCALYIVRPNDSIV